MLLDSCLSVCLSCLVCNVGALWPNGWMEQMKLGMQIGLGRGRIGLDGDPAPLSQKGDGAAQFSAHVYCGQMAG